MKGGEVVPQVPYFTKHLFNAWLGLISNTQKFLARYSLLPSHLHGEIKAQRIELTCLHSTSSSKWVLHLDARLNKAIHSNHFYLMNRFDGYKQKTILLLLTLSLTRPH